MYFIKKRVVEIEHFFRKKRRYLLHFNAILMPIYQHYRNARMMRSTCVLHENKLYFMKKCVVQIEHFFRNFFSLFPVFQCDIDANAPTSSERAIDAFIMCWSDELQGRR